MRLFANDQNKIRCGNVLFNRSRHGFVVVIAENVFLFCFYNRWRDANRNRHVYITRSSKLQCAAPGKFEIHCLGFLTQLWI